jgi:hypothetical protein
MIFSYTFVDNCPYTGYTYGWGKEDYGPAEKFKFRGKNSHLCGRILQDNTVGA